MEKLQISQKEQKIDSALILVAGGVIGIIGLIAEGKIFSNPTIDINAAITIAEGVVVGFGLSVLGGVRLRKLSRKN